MRAGRPIPLVTGSAVSHDDVRPAMAGTPVPKKSNGKGVCHMAMRKLRVYTGPDIEHRLVEPPTCCAAQEPKYIEYGHVYVERDNPTQGHLIFPGERVPAYIEAGHEAGLLVRRTVYIRE